MNQPKFSFGELVKHSSSTVFKVLDVSFHINNQDGTGEYKYNGGFWESELSPYREPKEIRAYAYEHQSGRLLYSTIETRVIVNGSNKMFIRNSAYDIYRDDNQSSNLKS